MGARKIDFDIVYLNLLPKEKFNPLGGEQQEWRKLSPKIEGLLRKLGKLAREGGSPEEISRVMGERWQLLQEWNALSNSYKHKYEDALYSQVQV